MGEAKRRKSLDPNYGKNAIMKKHNQKQNTNRFKKIDFDQIVQYKKKQDKLALEELNQLLFGGWGFDGEFDGWKELLKEIDLIGVDAFIESLGRHSFIHNAITFFLLMDDYVRDDENGNVRRTHSVREWVKANIDFQDIRVKKIFPSINFMLSGHDIAEHPYFLFASKEQLLGFKPL